MTSQWMTTNNHRPAHGIRRHRNPQRSSLHPSASACPAGDVIMPPRRHDAHATKPCSEYAHPRNQGDIVPPSTSNSYQQYTQSVLPECMCSRKDSTSTQRARALSRPDPAMQPSSSSMDHKNGMSVDDDEAPPTCPLYMPYLNPPT